MKRRVIPYSREELAWIKARKHMTRRDLHAAFCTRFNRDDVTYANIQSLCKRKGWLTGRTGQYQPGDIPANKGKKMPFNPNSAKTQFKKGQVPHNSKPLGHERFKADGYIEICVAERNPYTGYNRRYVLKHKWLWEKENGPVPDGMCLKCLDGDKTNTAPSNWKLIPREILPRLNGRFGRGYDQSAPEFKPLIMGVAELEHAARQAKESNNQ